MPEMPRPTINLRRAGLNASVPSKTSEHPNAVALDAPTQVFGGTRKT